MSGPHHAAPDSGIGHIRRLGRHEIANRNATVDQIS